jgi:hypothetical protein
VRILVFVLAYLVEVVILSIVVAGSIVLLLATAEGRDGLGALLVSSGVWLATHGPMLLGSIAAFWKVGRDASDGGRHLRGWVIGIVVTTVAGVALLIAAAALLRSAWWAVAIVVVVVAAFAFAAVPLGSLVRRIAARFEQPEPEFRVDTRPDARRVLVVTAVALAVTLGLAFGIPAARGASPDPLLVGFALVASAFAAAAALLPLAKRARATAGGDFGRLRRFVRVVARGKHEPLPEDERVAAVRYAVLFPALVSLQLVFFALLMAALVVLGIEILGSEEDGLLRTYYGILVIVSVGGFAAAVPQSLLRARRARRYAAEHADLLRDAEAPGAPAA